MTESKLYICCNCRFIMLTDCTTVLWQLPSVMCLKSHDKT